MSSDNDKAHYETIRSHLEHIAGMPQREEELETPVFPHLFPTLEALQQIGADIPPEGILYPLADSETLEILPAILKSDFTVWVYGEQIGTTDPETYEFIPRVSMAM